MEEKASSTTSMAAWPTSSAGYLSNLPQEAGVKMILTPKAYHATHDTMPPPAQVIMMAPTHNEQCQAADDKGSGKRKSEDQASSLRPPKQRRDQTFTQL